MAGHVLVACTGKPGRDGLGQHVAAVASEWREAGATVRLLATSLNEADRQVGGEEVPIPGLALVRFYSPARYRPDWQLLFQNRIFDRIVAARVHRAQTQAVVGFSGMCRRTFEKASSLGIQTRVLESPTVHVDRLDHQLRLAASDYPIERPWLHPALKKRMRREYELATEIRIPSSLAWRSFVQAGIPESRLRRRILIPADRFQPRTPPTPARPPVLVSVGSLSVGKGTPLLIDAFRSLEFPAELVLVGHSGSSGMRRWLARAMEQDPRIRLRPGDPLPEFQRATLALHPSYSDGFGYAIAEAIAVGVPILVSDESGAAELVTEGKGWILPAGDCQAWTTALRNALT